MLMMTASFEVTKMKLTRIVQTGWFADSDQAQEVVVEEEKCEEGGGEEDDRRHPRQYEVSGVNASFWTW